MSIITLFQREILDKYIRDNFRKLQDYINADPFAKGVFKFFTFDLASDVTHGYPRTLDVAHHLSFTPKDVLQLSVSPDTVTVTWKPDSFTDSTVRVTFSAACTVRAFIGRYEES